MEYCSKEDLKYWVLEAYLLKAEELIPGILDEMLAQVSNEITERLSVRFQMPLPQIPATLKKITAVLVGYRCLGAITSLMDTEAQSDNDLLYIQREGIKADKDLTAIATGSLDLALDNASKPIQVMTPKREFTHGLLKRY